MVLNQKLTLFDLVFIFQEGTNSVSFPVVILNDDVSEPDEAFFVYLHSPYGGVRVDSDGGVVKIIIEANDNPNGVIGFMKQGKYKCHDYTARNFFVK